MEELVLAILLMLLVVALIPLYLWKRRQDSRSPSNPDQTHQEPRQEAVVRATVPLARVECIVDRLLLVALHLMQRQQLKFGYITVVYLMRLNCQTYYTLKYRSWNGNRGVSNGSISLRLEDECTGRTGSGRLADAIDLEGIIKMALRVDNKNWTLELDKGVRTLKPASTLRPIMYSAQHNYSRVIQVSEPARGAATASHPSHVTKLDQKAQDNTIASSSTAISTTRKPEWGRRLPDSELACRREMGLCFKCGERYSPAHTCRDKHL
ncbi:hypothetical protein QN277_008633 [Acacia crassicarpa]|uniref:Uncharacterized protein n=1 Tax=Acacia crassicarpa TaxID=499986 RepID=A0AAE1IRJ6_9FABA|nr:hypothetical protein QN277_008633 [Acacia crassicarpa]